MPDCSKALIEILHAQGKMIATAESCTGGLISAALTDIAGSSDVFDRGFVTYSNQAKTDMLGVATQMLADHGAVSPEVAKAMSAGALKNSQADIALSVTGIAGPGGGSDAKPVGLVYIGLAVKDAPPVSYKHIFAGDRSAVRQQTVEAALLHAIEVLS